MSPEQFGDGETAGDVGPLADVYALGVILYELLTGVTPFTGGNPLALMLAHIQAQPKPPSARRSEIPAPVDALCLKALAKNATERFSSIKVLGDAIRDQLRLSVAATPIVPRLEALPKVGDRLELTLPGGVKVQFVYCPQGSFLMGSPSLERNRLYDEHEHRVVLTSGFWSGIYPITRTQFARFASEADYRTEAEVDLNRIGLVRSAARSGAPKWTWRDPGFKQTDEHPVTVISWNDAQAFCAWASKVCQRTVQLPSEAQWEYACRGNTATRYHIGSQLDRTNANFDSKSGGTTPVGQYLRTATHPWGLADCHGNVWEWCADLYQDNFYEVAPESDPLCTSANISRGRNIPRTEPDRLDTRFLDQFLKVARGGSWKSSVWNCRSASRGAFEPSAPSNQIGFRVMLPGTE